MKDGARIFFALFVISRYSTSQTSSGSTNVAPFTAASSGSSIGGVSRVERLELRQHVSSIWSVKPVPT